MRKLRILALFALVLVSLGWTSRALAANITIDGNPADWPGNPTCTINAAGCSLIANDVNEAGVPDSLDIQTVWATNSATTAFFRFDTFANTSYAAGEFVRICLGIPGQSGDDTVGGCAGLPTDRLVVITDFGSGLEARIFNCNVVNCASPFATPVATGVFVNVGTVNEISVPLTALGITGVNDGDNISVITYADNNALPPDDNIPDSGIINWPIGTSSPTAITLSSLNATTAASALSGQGLAWAGFALVAAGGLGGLLLRRRRVGRI